MRENGLVPKGKKKHVVTTNAKDSVNIFPNLLKRDFTAEAKNQKMVSDTTYIYTEEGWLYLAAIMDLYGRKIVGMAISERNDKELVIEALEEPNRKEAAGGLYSTFRSWQHLCIKCIYRKNERIQNDWKHEQNRKLLG